MTQWDIRLCTCGPMFRSRFVSNSLAMRGYGYRNSLACREVAFPSRPLTGDSAWRRKIWKAFPQSTSQPEAESQRKPRAGALFLKECRSELLKLLRSNNLLRLRKVLYLVLVEVNASGRNDLANRWGRFPPSGIGPHDRAILTTRVFAQPIKSRVISEIWTSVSRVIVI